MKLTHFSSNVVRLPRVPLLVTHRPGDPTLEALSAPGQALGRLRNYCGSVAFDAASRVLAVTSPVGGGTVLTAEVPCG